MLHDIRYTLRQLARRPGFTAVAILTLAIGIGANTAIFSAARAALFAPLPFEHEDRLVRVYMTPEAGGPLISLRPAVFTAIQERARAFDAIVAQRFTGYALATDAGPERVVGIAVSDSWGETLGVRPHLGRLFSPDEEALGEDSGVLVLSYGAWQRRFGGERSALGQVVELDGRPHTVIGVMPPGFRYPYEAELWVPMQVRGPQRGVWAFNAPARLAPGWTVEAAREDLRAVAAAASGEVSELQPGTTLTAVPLREVFIGDEGRTLVALLAAVGFFLLIVCANLANLLLARALGRSREFALRAAVGASRGRLIRQLLVESVVLAALGGAAGIAVAYFGGALVEPLLPSRLSFVGAAPTIDEAVLIFGVTVSMGSGLLFGIVPALRLSHKRPFAALQSATRSIGSHGGRRLERALVIGELALALTLLTGIGLMLKDFRRLASAELGYETAGLMTFGVSLSLEAYPTPESRADFATAAEREVRGLAGVAAAGATTMFPSSQGASLAEPLVEGREIVQGEVYLIHDRIVTPGFLETLGPPLVRGRRLTEGDRADRTPVVVVSAALAERLWPEADPIGERVRNAREGDDSPWMNVVGVVGDVKEFYDVETVWYRPYAQHADSRAAARMVFAVRGQGEAAMPLGALRRAITAVDPGLPIFNAATAADLYSGSFTRQSQAAMLGSVFATFALILAAIGIYGTISYGVSRRTREIGVRMALGSDRRAVLRNIADEGGRLVVAGLAIGLGGALIVARLLARALTEVGAFDLVTFVASGLVLAAAGFAATLIPALRATRIDPVEALRHE